MTDRDWADAEYSRIYWTVVDDPKFEHVFDDDRRWAAYTRLLMAADATYPSAAAIPRWLAEDVLEHLVEARIVEVVRRSSYRIVGLKAEREGRKKGRAIGGKKRAEEAERDEFGHFLPKPASDPAMEPASDPASDPATPASPSKGASKEVAGAASNDPAAQLRRGRDSERDENEDSLSPETTSRARRERADVAALRQRGWKRVTAKQRAVLDEVLARHDKTGAEFAAEVIRNTPPDRDPLEAVMDADQRWQEHRRAQADAAEHGWNGTKARERDEAREVTEDGPTWMPKVGSMR